jgi:hypothetical protein
MRSECTLGHLWVAALVVLSPLRVESATATLQMLDNRTREVKNYEFGAQPFKVDVRFVPGWTHCVGRPLKTFDFRGKPTVRAELLCYTSSSAFTMASCVASSGVEPLSTTVMSIVGSGAKFDAMGDINAPGAAELSLVCIPD